MDNRSLKQLEKVKSSFEFSSLPFAVLNKNFAPYFISDSLYSLFPSLSNPINLIMLFKDNDLKLIINYLKADGSYAIQRDMPEKEGVRFVLNAVFDEDKEFCGVLIFADVLSTENSNNLKVRDVNHEFQDRLSMMFNCIYALSRSNDLEPTPAICEYINSMNQNCFQLLRVSNNLSKFLLLSNGEDFAKLKLADISVLIKKLCDGVILMSNKNLIPISYDITNEVLPVLVDAARLEFIFSNVILNSIKYTKPDNKIHVSLSRVSNNAILTISDCGVGIPKDVLSSIGTPYFTYSHGDKFETGFGLGIYMTKKYVSSLGGTFMIQSEENEGTTVTISFPINNDPVGNITEVNSPPQVNPLEKFSQTAIQLSEVCFYPEL